MICLGLRSITGGLWVDAVVVVVVVVNFVVVVVNFVVDVVVVAVVDGAVIIPFLRPFFILFETLRRKLSKALAKLEVTVDDVVVVVVDVVTVVVVAVAAVTVVFLVFDGVDFVVANVVVV